MRQLATFYSPWHLVLPRKHPVWNSKVLSDSMADCYLYEELSQMYVLWVAAFNISQFLKHRSPGKAQLTCLFNVSRFQLRCQQPCIIIWSLDSFLKFNSVCLERSGLWSCRMLVLVFICWMLLSAPGVCSQVLPLNLLTACSKAYKRISRHCLLFLETYTLLDSHASDYPNTFYIQHNLIKLLSLVSLVPCQHLVKRGGAVGGHVCKPLVFQGHFTILTTSYLLNTYLNIQT